MSIRVSPVGIMLAIAISTVATVSAASSSARLVYVRNAGAETCPDERAIRAAVGARLGYDPFLSDAPSTLFAEVSAKANGFAARIRLIDSTGAIKGTREIDQAGDRCNDIVDAMALSMSLSIDPESLDGPRPVSNSNSNSNPNSGPRERPLAGPSMLPMAIADPGGRAPKIPASQANPLTLSLGFGPTFWLGAAPSASVGGIAFVRARRNVLSLALEGRADLHSSRTLSQGAVETSLIYGTIAPCVHVRFVSACALGALGRIRGTSRDVAFPREDSSLHAALGVRARADLRFSEIASLFGSIDALYTLTPQRLLLNGMDVYAVPRLSGGVTVGVMVDVF